MPKSYLDRKEAWAKKMIEKGMHNKTEKSTERLPPGQHTVDKLPVLDLGIQPKIDKDDWILKIGGEVESEIELDWKGLMGFNQVEEMSDFHCVTTWSKYDCKWGGIKMIELLDKVRPSSSCLHVLFISYDGYTTNVPIEAVFSKQSLLATSLDGEPLPTLVIPHLYAQNILKKFILPIIYTTKIWMEDRFIDKEVQGGGTKFCYILRPFLRY